MPRTPRTSRKVFVTRQIDPGALIRLRDAAQVLVWDEEMPPPAAALRAALTNADAVLSMVTDKIDASMIAGAPRLRVISNLAVGVDNIDLEAATRAGIAVGHTPGVLTEATADLAFGLLMATARRIAEADRHVRAGKWRTWGPMTMLGRDVHSSTLGLIGFGAIGQAMARRAMGFGMRVLYLKHPPGNRKLPRDARLAGRCQLEPFAGPIGLCIDSRAADGKDASHDRGARVCSDEAARDSNQHGARRCHRSGCDGGGAEIWPLGWCGSGCDRSGAYRTSRSSSSTQQCRDHAAHRQREHRRSRAHGGNRGRQYPGRVRRADAAMVRKSAGQTASLKWTQPERIIEQYV